MMSRTEKKVMGGREQVRVCIAQRSPAFLDRDATVQRGVAIIAEAAANGADPIVFPEVWLARYPATELRTPRCISRTNSLRYPPFPAAFHRPVCGRFNFLTKREIVMLTFRAVQSSRVAMLAVFAAVSAISSSSQRRSRACLENPDRKLEGPLESCARASRS